MVHRRHAADGVTVGPVNRRHVGDQGIADILQLARKNVHQRDVAALAGPVQGYLLAVVEFHDLGAELARLFAVVFRRHRLDFLVGHDVLDDAHVGRNALVGEGVAVTLVLVRQEGEDVHTKHVRRDENDRLEVRVDLDAFLDRQDLVELEGVGFVDQLVGGGIEMETELLADRLDLLVKVRHSFHDFGFALHVAAQLLAIGLQDRVQQRARGLFNLVEGVVGHLALRASQTLAGHADVMLHDLEGFHHAERIVARGGHRDLRGNVEVLIELAHFAVGRAHHRHRVAHPAGCEIGHLF